MVSISHVNALVKWGVRLWCGDFSSPDVSTSCTCSTSSIPDLATLIDPHRHTAAQTEGCPLRRTPCCLRQQNFYIITTNDNNTLSHASRLCSPRCVSLNLVDWSDAVVTYFLSANRLSGWRWSGWKKARKEKMTYTSGICQNFIFFTCLIKTNFFLFHWRVRQTHYLPSDDHRVK